MSATHLESPRALDRFLGAVALPFGLMAMSVVPAFPFFVLKIFVPIAPLYFAFPCLLAGLACIAVCGTRSDSPSWRSIGFRRHYLHRWVPLVVIADGSPQGSPRIFEEEHATTGALH